MPLGKPFRKPVDKTAKAISSKIAKFSKSSKRPFNLTPPEDEPTWAKDAFDKTPAGDPDFGSMGQSDVHASHVSSDAAEPPASQSHTTVVIPGKPSDITQSHASNDAITARLNDYRRHLKTIDKHGSGVHDSSDRAG